MAILTSEELIINRLNATIAKIKKGKQKPSDESAETASRFRRLKPLNEGMHDELFLKYTKAVLNFVPAAIPATRKATR